MLIAQNILFAVICQLCSQCILEMLLLHGDHVADKLEPRKNVSWCGKVPKVNKFSLVPSYFFSPLKVLLHEGEQLEQDFNAEVQFLG